MFAALCFVVDFGFFMFSYWRKDPIHVLHWDDESIYHYPLILKYIQNGFFLRGDDYTTATTPLFHVVSALLGRILGTPSPWPMRAFNVAVTVAVPVAFFRILAPTTSRLNAWVLSLALHFAPYMWARGFVLLTENLATLMVLLALTPMFVRGPANLRQREMLWAAFFLVLAVLTRQQWVWLAPWISAEILLRDASLAPVADSPRPPVPIGRRIQLCLPLLAPVLVLVPFLLMWRGFVPPNFHAANQSGATNWRAVVFTLTALGFYMTLLAPSQLISTIRASPRVTVLVACLAASLCLLSGLRFRSIHVDNGYLWKVSTMFPNVFGANVFLSAFAVLGALIWVAAFRGGPRWLGSFVLVFAISVSHVNMNFQKYYEVTLLIAVLIFARSVRASRLDRVAQALWLVAGFSYIPFKLVTQYGRGFPRP